MVGILINNKINNILLFKSGHQKKIRERKWNKNIIFHTLATWYLEKYYPHWYPTYLKIYIWLPIKDLWFRSTTKKNKKIKKELAKKRKTIYMKYFQNAYRVKSEKRQNKTKLSQHRWNGLFIWVAVGFLYTQDTVSRILILNSVLPSFQQQILKEKLLYHVFQVYKLLSRKYR